MATGLNTQIWDVPCHKRKWMSDHSRHDLVHPDLVHPKLCLQAIYCNFPIVVSQCKAKDSGPFRTVQFVHKIILRVC